LGDTGISKTFGCDHGIAAQSILLGAADRGLGGCMIGSIDRDALRKKLDIDDHLQILLVIALGRPAERVVLEDMTPQTGIEYYRDQQGIHHVPKRPLDQIIIK
jgi:nitroreductase